MAAYLLADDVNQWLEATRLTLTDPLETGLDTFHRESVFGVLAARYNTALWVDRASTPALILQVLAMLFAATQYRSQYSEDSTANPAWPVWLETTANNTLAAIESGNITLTTSATTVQTLSQSIDFYPKDINDEDDPRAFSMSVVY